MRVLLKDKRDGALAVVETIEMNYDPSDKELCICLMGGDSYVIEGLEINVANALISKLYEDGKLSVTDYAARYDEAEDIFGN